jgi:hypothetical protein
MKKSSTSLAIREMDSKMILRFHLTVVRMACIKKTKNNKCWPAHGDNRIFIHYWKQCKLVQPLWKSVWRALRTLKMEILYDSATPSLGIYLKESKSAYNSDIYISMFIAELLTITKLQKKPW